MSSSGLSAEAVAAVDCGTNSTRLLVADTQGTTLAREMEITRLGQGVDQDGRLATEAIARTTATLRRYREIMDQHGVGKIRVTATSAARDASNRDELFAAVREAVGAEPELLSGAEEGRLSFLGATSDLPDSQAPWLVVDIGGGSTEFVLGDRKQLRTAGRSDVAARGGPHPVPGGLEVISTQMGCVRVTERFLPGDPPAQAQLSEAREFVDAQVNAAADRFPGFRTARTLVGLAGTVSATSRLLQGLETYERSKIHHSLLAADQVRGLLGRLSGLTVDQRLAIPGMESGRADVLVGGLMVLDAVMRLLEFDQCLVSESDILDGLVSSIL